MMRVIVAGGTGLVGRRLVAALAVAGEEVVVLSRRRRVTVPGARVERWDGRTPSGAWMADLVDAAAVVNLAGASVGGRRWTRRRRRAIRVSRVEATGALVDAIAALPADRRPAVLVNASGIDYAGDGGDTIVDEDTPAGTSFLASVCVEWEQAARAAERHGVRVVCLRTPLVLAGEAKALRLLALPFRLFLGGRLGSGRQWFPWIHVDDLAALIQLAIADGRTAGPLNAVAPDLRRQRDVAAEFGRILHRPAALPAPTPLLRLALGRQADLLLHGQRARTRRLNGLAFRYPDLTSALEDALR